MVPLCAFFGGEGLKGLAEQGVVLAPARTRAGRREPSQSPYSNDAGRRRGSRDLPGSAMDQSELPERLQDAVLQFGLVERALRPDVDEDPAGQIRAYGRPR